ncbi:MAG: cbb3-type cytochrome c oxidase subunit 3 [Zoogloeaceae bacterium]|jgi:cytochrome c oxidase cbb3-type subunit 4|nr:cbb3-type cytochrome c oxidase subunit 3 [Zoogloeaceae bacterium]
MDLGDIRGTLTPLLGIVLILGIIFWAYSGKQKKAHEEAAQLPFTDDEANSASEGFDAIEQRKVI